MSNTEKYGRMMTVEEAMANVTVTVEEVPVVAPAVPTQPEVVKAVSQDVQVGTFVNKSGLTVVQSLPNPKSKYGPTGISGTLIANLCTFSNFAYDARAWNTLATLPVELNGNKINPMWSWGALEVASKSIASSGTLSGLLNRMHTGLKRPKPAFNVAKAMEMAKLGGFVMDKSQVPSFKVEGRTATLAEAVGPLGGSPPVVVNVASSAGCPWVKEKSKVMPDMMLWAAKALEALANGKWIAFQDQNPELFLTFVKNKLEVYERAELKEKTRPYYQFSGALTLLWSCVSQRLTSAFPVFTAHETSTNAIGHKWNGGGATRLAEWIEECRVKGPGLYAGIYADDQLWVFVMEDGTVHVGAPDYKMMDMSLSRLFGVVTYRLTEGAVDDDVWKAVLKSCCSLGFVGFVCLPGSSVVMKEDGLFSGVPMTSYFDLVASQTALGHIRSKLAGNLKDFETLSLFLQRMWIEIQKEYGLEVKPETTDLYEWSRPQTAQMVPPFDIESGRVTTMQEYRKLLNERATPWVFLGLSLMPYRRSNNLTGFDWIPVARLNKLVTALVCPKSRGAPEVVQRAAAERCRGIQFAGGAVYPGYYQVCKHIFTLIVKNGYAPVAEVEEDKTTMDMPMMGPGEFPSREAIFAWLLGDEFVGAEVVDQNIGAANAAIPQKQTSYSETLQRMRATQSVDWGDIVEDVTDQIPEIKPGAVASADSIAPPSIVAPQYRARSQPDLAARKKKAEKYKAFQKNLKDVRSVASNPFLDKKTKNQSKRRGGDYLSQYYKAAKEDFGEEFAEETYQELYEDYEAWERTGSAKLDQFFDRFYDRVEEMDAEMDRRELVPKA